MVRALSRIIPVDLAQGIEARVASIPRQKQAISRRRLGLKLPGTEGCIISAADAARVHSPQPQVCMVGGAAGCFCRVAEHGCVWKKNKVKVKVKVTYPRD